MYSNTTLVKVKWWDGELLFEIVKLFKYNTC